SLAIFRHRPPVGYAHIWDRSVFTSIGFAEGIGERQKRNCVKSRNFSKGSNGVYCRVLRVFIKATLSALGQKQTYAVQKAMSALPKRGHSAVQNKCLLRGRTKPCHSPTRGRLSKGAAAIISFRTFDASDTSPMERIEHAA